MDDKLAKGYWKGITAIKKLTTAAKVSENAAKKWLVKQALWQVYLTVAGLPPCATLHPSPKV